ncbi:F-box/LRR-repeat protein 25-like [Bidens hawaiensis]|uniref:F-box/LRR-repeat protein 25-like n=1 Tax=Bidens hawaiensis TaxID=980011 RepID=UPI0040494857
MTEEGQNQPLKQIRLEDEDDENRISKLPDCLLVEILSRLPQTIYAVRTGALSKRWKHVWTWVQTLVFRHPYYFVRSRDGSSPDFFSFVDKTLTQRPQLKLNKFTLCSRYNYMLESHINNWIRYAVNCNVEELDLWVWGLERIIEIPRDQFFFICSSFTRLKSSGCALIPTGAISWKNLRSLHISYGRYLDEVLIENILSGSPVLETLVLDYCDGYRRLNITSKTVKNLVFCRYLVSSQDYPESEDFLDVIEINAPNISSLTIQDHLYSVSKLLLLNVSSLVKARLDYKLLDEYEEDEEEMFKGFILSLRHVKDIQIGPCFDVKLLFFW